MGFRIVLIGGGSCLWTPTLAKDLFLRTNLAGSELVLVDIDPAAAKLLASYCRMIAGKIGTGWKVSVADHRAALRGADFVCASISTGGFETMHRDYTIPEEFGVYHTVADTVGPGGISRTLRNVPVFVGFARMMEKLCPNAWLVHVTNPLSQLTRAVYKTSSIRCVGLCHNYVGTTKLLAWYFGVRNEDVDAVSVGVNHGTWMKNITVKGRPVADQLDLQRYLKMEAAKQAPRDSGTVDDQVEEMLKTSNRVEYYLSFELFKKFGYFPVGGAPHVAENFPFYCNSPETLARHYIHRKGVLPNRADWKEQSRRKIQAITRGKHPLPELTASNEGLAEIADGLLTGHPCREIVSMPNRGQVANLPRDVVVETHALISYDGVSPVNSGSVPAPLLGWLQTVVDEQELAVQAALTGDRDLVVQAMTVSPMLADKDRAAELAWRLLNANRDWLPQFFKKRR